MYIVSCIVICCRSLFMYLYSDEVKRLREERESQAAELAQLREELRIAQEEKEERQREVERLQIEKQQQVSRHLFFAFVFCSSSSC